MREWTKETFHSAYETYSTMVYRLCMLYLKNESEYILKTSAGYFLENMGEEAGFSK